MIKFSGCDFRDLHVAPMYNRINHVTVWDELSGGAVASWLVRSSNGPGSNHVRRLSPPQRPLSCCLVNNLFPIESPCGGERAGDIALCFRARHFTLIAPLSTLMDKWIPANPMLGVTPRWTSIPLRGK